MTNIMPYRSNRNLGSRDFFKRFFGDDLFGDFDTMMMPGGKAFSADIRENDNEYFVEAELPGVDRDNIEISLHDDVLTISAKKEENKENKDGKYIRRERFSGSVSRSFYVENVDEDKISAKLEDGVLKIELPKADVKRSARKIEIS